MRQTLSESLERGRLPFPLAGLASRVWTPWARRRYERRLVWPRGGPPVVCVAGPTLGGSGKTPLALACARALAARGQRVAVVGHAYRARPLKPRIVSGFDPLTLVGDEALLVARALGSRGICVVAPSGARQEAIDLAAAHADVVVIDGVLQATPRRAALSLLAVDPTEPWGSGIPFPRGDLMADPAWLIRLADAVVPVELVLAASSVDGLAAARVGLVTAIARPQRVLEALRARGIAPVIHVRWPDHGPGPGRGGAGLARAAKSSRVDVWLATPKCALHVAPVCGHTPLRVLESDCLLKPWLVAQLSALGPPTSTQADRLSPRRVPAPAVLGEHLA